MSIMKPKKEVLGKWRRSSSAVPASSITLSFLFCFFIVFLVCTPFVMAENRTLYDWEELNHYEILYLTNILRENETSIAEIKASLELIPRDERKKEREAVKRSDVRKAYFNAAKLHHPDKVIGRKRQRERSASGIHHDEPLSYEEVNARMAKIAGAYEILSDAEKKRRYDWYLLHYEENQLKAKRYAAEMDTKLCKFDDDCNVESGQCCIKFHFNFCGRLDKYPAKGLQCSGLSSTG